MQIKQVGVVGAGTMGNGIAHVFARAGYAVTLYDVEQRFLDRALEAIAKNLARESSKGKITAEQESAARARIIAVVDRGKRTCGRRRRDAGRGHFGAPLFFAMRVLTRPSTPPA